VFVCVLVRGCVYDESVIASCSVCEREIEKVCVCVCVCMYVCASVCTWERACLCVC